MNVYIDYVPRQNGYLFYTIGQDGKPCYHGTKPHSTSTACQTAAEKHFKGKKIGLTCN